jgi:hypothetical protein
MIMVVSSSAIRARRVGSDDVVGDNEVLARQPQVQMPA